MECTFGMFLRALHWIRFMTMMPLLLEWPFEKGQLKPHGGKAIKSSYNRWWSNDTHIGPHYLPLKNEDEDEFPILGDSFGSVPHQNTSYEMFPMFPMVPNAPTCPFIHIPFAHDIEILSWSDGILISIEHRVDHVHPTKGRLDVMDSKEGS